MNRVQTFNRMNRDEPCTDKYVSCTYKDELQRTMYRHASIVCIQCTNMYIQIKMHVSRFIPCSDQVYTSTAGALVVWAQQLGHLSEGWLGAINAFTSTHCILIHVCVHTCLVLVHILYIPSTYIECTSASLYVHRTQKQKVS